MRSPWFVLPLLLLATAGGASGLRVLGFFPFPGPSHFIMFKALLEGLQERGHEVLVFSPFPSKTPRANWTDVDTSHGRPSLVSTFSFELVQVPWWSLPGWETYKAMSTIAVLAGANTCREVFAMAEFKRLMSGGYGRFDVVLTEVFASDCWAAVAYKMGVPLVSLSSAPDVGWLHERIGSVDNPSYLPNVFTDFRAPMTLWERLNNAATTALTNYLFRTLLQDDSDHVVREVFGPGVPPQRELVKNTSLVLVNRHVSIHAARPLVPSLVHVGGLHIKTPPGTLDASLRAWMDGAEHGVVFFSLGSLLRAATMPADKRDALLAAFATLPQRVVWKWEDDGLQVPDNVRVAKWLSQLDILTHPKTVLFITHGGLMGTLEALHSSVPMLGIPLFADQKSNVQMYLDLGIAGRLDFADITAEAVTAKITEMTTQPRYRQRAREVAALFKDRPQTAAAEAVWWVEYVVRHRGARHLRTAAVDMPLHQYLLLDVLLLGAVLTVGGGALVVWLVGVVARLVAAATDATPAPRRRTSKPKAA